MNVEEALDILRSAKAGSEVLFRDKLVAFATLFAFRDHWPTRASAEVRELLEHFDFLREEEPDRFVKQRRIALSLLAQQLCDAAV